mmetsp:Transcript_11136/g.25362  ORF Transcript_11136/g.25362 Transcript_11136/m.25362 type:complete len:264 (+) Transcript_11136:245-1036(+)
MGASLAASSASLSSKGAGTRVRASNSVLARWGDFLLHATGPKHSRGAPGQVLSLGNSDLRDSMLPGEFFRSMPVSNAKLYASPPLVSMPPPKQRLCGMGGQQHTKRRSSSGSLPSAQLSRAMVVSPSATRQIMPAPAESRKIAKNRPFRSPTQHPIQKQWWSRPIMQRWQMWQWPQRFGRQSLHSRHHFCRQGRPSGVQRSRMRRSSSCSSAGAMSVGSGTGKPGSTRWQARHARITRQPQMTEQTFRTLLTGSVALPKTIRQ